MNGKTSFFVVLLGLLVLCGACQSASQNEYANIPYSLPYRFAMIENKLSNAPDKNVIVMTVTSKLPDVKPEDIEMYIASQSGDIPLKVEPDGTCVIPLSEELWEEKPLIITNQPEGTLNHKLDFEVQYEGSIKLFIPFAKKGSENKDE